MTVPQEFLIAALQVIIVFGFLAIAPRNPARGYALAALVVGLIVVALTFINFKALSL